MRFDFGLEPRWYEMSVHVSSSGFLCIIIAENFDVIGISLSSTCEFILYTDTHDVQFWNRTVKFRISPRSATPPVVALDKVSIIIVILYHKYLTF